MRLVDIISEQQAFEEIEKGRFFASPGFKLSSIDIFSVELSYTIDSKGFLQPVYHFHANIDGHDTYLIVPAL